MAGFVGHAPVMNKVRRVAAVLAVAASVSTVAGSALPLFKASLHGGVSPTELTYTPWTVVLDDGRSVDAVPADGYPLVFVAVLLAFAAFLCRAAGRPGVRPRTVRVAEVVTTTAGAFLACAVWMVVLQVRNWDDNYRPREFVPTFAQDTETSYLAGLWVLVVAGVLGVAAAVFVWLPGTPVVVPVAAPPAEADPDAPTPPFGIALPLPPEEPVEQVDPLTGQPARQEPPPEVPEVRAEPIVIPEAPPPVPPPGPAVPSVEDPLAEPRGD